jgi:hypothetical protein
MSQQQYAGGDERFLRRYEYDDEWVVAVDLDVADDAVDVDVVGRTAIVVVETGERVVETEFELPAPAAKIDVNNGVLVVTGDR